LAPPLSSLDTDWFHDLGAAAPDDIVARIANEL